jgi:hypothetical protein
MSECLSSQQQLAGADSMVAIKYQSEDEMAVCGEGTR